MKKVIWLTFVLSLYNITHLQAQTVSFSFSAAAHTTPGWINLAGDPSLAVITASDPSTGIGISSVATANWYPYNRTNASYDAAGVNTDGFFPGTVLYNQWFQYNPAGSGLAYYNQSIPQFIISGLNAGSVYTIKLSGSNAFGFDSHDTRYTVAGVIVYPPMDLNTTNNTALGSTFNNISPDATGKIMVYVNTVANTELADISGLQIIASTTTTPTPIVRFTSPHNNDLVPEDGNLVLTATASETGGSIAKVQFYRDTLLLGQALSPPYTFTWTTPDPGSYTLIAKALDNLGGSATSTIHITVQSLNYFWSTTGNIATGGDTSFVGTVDSNRLAFRTKNIERMSILPTGNIGIGTKTPSAQLHTTGSVRLAGLTSDSTKTRVLVSDTSGNLYYRSAASLGSAGGWATGGNAGTNPASNFIGTTDAQRLVFKTNGVENMTILANGAVGIGTSSQVQPDAKLFVKGFIYAQKVRVTQQNWADYVFKKDYRLPSLAEVEQYIAQYQHLPGVTSAAEVRSKGLDLGDNQAVLLKKIEELTLYLIRQDKKLEEQDKKSEEQDKELQGQTQQLEEQQKTLKLQQEKIDRLEKLLLQVMSAGKASTK